MKMNIGVCLSYARAHYPKFFGIRKKLQAIKVKRIYRHTMSAEEIACCENNKSRIPEMVAPYKKRYEKFLRPFFTEMEYILTNAPEYKNRQDLDFLRADMLFCRLAYGFIPSEYVGFELEGKSPVERKTYVSDLDTNVFGYSVNDIAEVQSVLDKAKSSQRYREMLQRDIVIIESEKDRESFLHFLNNHPVFVKKKVFSSMGKGVELVDISRIRISRDALFDKLISQGKWLLEELVIQDKQMGVFNPSSVNTVRCITLNTRGGGRGSMVFYEMWKNRKVC